MKMVVDMIYMHFSALYANCLAGNLVEQLWNFAWPAAIALIHPSLLPVAVMSFFTKVCHFPLDLYTTDISFSISFSFFPFLLQVSFQMHCQKIAYYNQLDAKKQLVMILGGPLVGKLMDSMPRVPCYNCLSLVQVITFIL